MSDPNLFNVALPKALSRPPNIGVGLGVEEVTTSRTWTAPCDGILDILAFGAGGSGGACLGLTASTQRATGGNAGPMGFKRVVVRKGDQVVFALGTGGAAKALLATAAENGNDGGVTTVTGPGFRMSLPGGKGGVGLDTSAAVNPQTNSPVTGADMFLLGGQGGAIAASATAAHAATGGGAPNITGTPRNGGDVTSISGALATGGGSVDLNGAGSASGPSAGASVSRTFGIGYLLGYMLLSGNGTAGVTNNSSSAVTTFGPGSGGVVTNGNHVTGAVPFGGSGGIDSAGFGNNTGEVAWCGGSGGSTGNTATVRTARGGNAFALINFYPGG